MSRMRKRAGSWIGLTYILLKIPFWVLCIDASSYHDLVWGFPELFEPPYSPYIGPSLALAEAMSVMAVIWTFGFGAFACAVGNRHGRWYLFAGLFDAIIVSGLFTAAYFQSTFLPKPLGKCWNADIWPYNQTYNASAPTLFEVLAGNATLAEDQCSDLLTVWEMEISMGIMLSMTCLIAWTMAVRSFFFLPRDRPHHQSGPLGADMLPFLRFLLAPFWCLIQPFILKVVSGFRYWFRYREKKSQSLEQTKQFAMESFPIETKDLEYQNDSSVVTIVGLDSTSQIVDDRKLSTLEVVLSCYSPVLHSIMTGLHFVDIVNLQLTSKAIRNALDANSLETLRVTSCVSGTKSECWSCRKQICIDCKKDHKLKNPATTQHLKTCELICSKCFYKSCCNGKISKGGRTPRPPPCSGHDSDFRTSNPAISRELCTNCSLSELGDILAARGKREERELAQVSEISKKCGKCKKLVNAIGPRWWFCTRCSKECTERYHSAWRLSEDI